MFSLKSLLARGRNRRRKRITRLLMSVREFERAILKERQRCDRYQIQFSLISIELYSQDEKYRREVRELAKILLKRLRITDERGHLAKERIGILLPHTGRAGAIQVLDSIGAIAAQREIYFKAEIMIYPQDEDRSIPESEDSGRELEPVREGIRSGVSAESIAWSDSYIRMQSTQYPKWKRFMDVTGAFGGIAIGAPILLAAAIAIKLNSPGPILFKQRRTGYCGIPFTIFKLRTMVIDADQQKADLMESNERDGPAFKMKRDPRVTTVGRWLRAVGLDELPQLWNVLKGDMALVGPRPLPCHEGDQCNPWQQRRLDRKPGITCIWQISKSEAVDFDHWMRMDLKYVDNPGMISDVRLLLQTIYAVVRGRVEH